MHHLSTAERTTRSSKAKNLQYGLEDPEQAEKQLSAQLKAMGLYAANTLGDGNCLFRALSDQLYGYPNQHLHIRHVICDYLQAHPEKYAGFVDDAKPFDAYVRNMRIQGTYGGHLELSAFAHLKRKEIKIVQPNLVYVVAADADDDEENAAHQRSSEPVESGIGSASLTADGLPPTARQLRKIRRESKAPPPSTSSATAPNTPNGSLSQSSQHSASSSTSTVPSSSTPSKASTSVPVSANTALAPVSNVISSPAAREMLRTQPSPSSSRAAVQAAATPPRTPAAPVIVEAAGPLYIAYHNWEHYSSIRNLDGPHSGLPKIKEKPINQAALAEEFSSIAAKAARRGGLPLGKGKGKANTRPGTSSLDSEQPTEEEKLILESAPGHSLFEVRQLLTLLGSWEDVVEKLVAEDAEAPRPVANRSSSPNKGQDRIPRPTSAHSRSASPIKAPLGQESNRYARRGSGAASEDAIVITDDDDDMHHSQMLSNPAQRIGPSSSSSRLPHSQHHQQHPLTLEATAGAWRAGSPSSVGTAASARSSATARTTTTSTSTSTVPTSDDWNPRVGTSKAADKHHPLADDDLADEQYLALSPDSTTTAREMSVLADDESQKVLQPLGISPAALAEMNGEGRMSPSGFKRKAHQGHDVGADGDEDSELSNKRFSPARGQFVEQPTTAACAIGRPHIVPSSVSPSIASSSSPRPSGEHQSRPSADVLSGQVIKSGLSRFDAISIGSGSSSDSDVPIGLLLRTSMKGGSAAMGLDGRDSDVELAMSRRSVPIVKGQWTSERKSGGSTNTSGDDASIATSRPRRSAATPIDYRASALGRSGAPGPGQTVNTVSSTSSSSSSGAHPSGALSKRAKRDQKRAEKVEKERAKARARRLGRGLGIAEDEDSEDEDEHETQGSAPTQFSFRELRI
ncbi:hypothetical protein OC845_000665 [Tilletia horrida]|nr:hypothetical protein OC845_000665 [Tilletia horrida]